MNVIVCSRPVIWGEIDLPLFGLARDWDGQEVHPPAAFCLAADPSHFWFIASHGRPARLHPAARPGKFIPGLWEYDVAELFLSHPASGRYFEFNLAPNSAWWSCEFTGPRQRAEEEDIVPPGIATYSELLPDGGWVAAMSIPRGILSARLDFGPETFGNVTFILGSPQQQFLSAASLGGATPDFHQPAQFSRLAFVNP